MPRTKITIKECQEFAKSKNGECLSTEYKNNSTKMQWKCSKNHTWFAKFGDIKQGSWCPKCKTSKGEKAIYTILQNKLNNTEFKIKHDKSYSHLTKIAGKKL